MALQLYHWTARLVTQLVSANDTVSLQEGKALIGHLLPHERLYSLPTLVFLALLHGRCEMCQVVAIRNIIRTLLPWSHGRPYLSTFPHMDELRRPTAEPARVLEGADLNGCRENGEILKVYGVVCVVARCEWHPHIMVLHFMWRSRGSVLEEPVSAGHQ
mmetsp:Transcript_20334/g.30324  ORF Transcript_20334/g.30324 Transcript_20334/m.30324 type:complete len:159 (+) Transcript_20334:273-749(+)